MLAAHLLRLHPGDYFAINAYLEMSEDNQRELQAIRKVVRELLERKRRVVRVDLLHAHSLATLRTMIEQSI